MRGFWDTVIVGGGPAGLFAGISAAQHGARVLILERQEKPGGKIPASGGGRANLTHAGELPELLRHYHGGEKPKEAARFIKPALYSFSNRDLMEFFSVRGLSLVVEPDGRVFPETYRAEDALRVLLREAEQLKVEILIRTRVLRIKPVPRGFELFVPGKAGPVAKSLTMILATGGRAYPQFGGSDDGYRLATQLGHRVVPLRPALVPVLVAPPAFAPFSKCAGITVRNVVVTLIHEGEVVRKTCGDVLFTQKGLSGPAVLDLSRDVEPGDLLRVAFVSGMNGASVERYLLAQAANRGRRTVARALQELGIPLGLARALMEALGISATHMAELSRSERRALVDALALGYPFPLVGTAGWEEAMVTRGGVALAEVSSKTMESRIVPGLFFAGEILDIDGESGGYNLQAAFSTGFLAGKSAAEKAKTVE